MQRVPERELPSIAEINAPIRRNICVFVLILIILVIYLFKEHTLFSKYFTTAFIIICTLNIAYLYRQLKEEAKFSSQERAFENRFYFQEKAEEPNLRLSQSKLGISRDVIEKAERFISNTEFRLQNPVATSPNNYPMYQSPERKYVRPEQNTMRYHPEYMTYPTTFAPEEAERPKNYGGDRSIFSESYVTEYPRLNKSLNEQKNGNKSTISRGNFTTSKASVTYKNETKNKDIQSLSEKDDESHFLRQFLKKLEVSQNLFFMWCEGRMQRWIVSKLIPELIERNIRNLKAINDHLVPFKIEIIEYFFCNKAIESRREEELNESFFDPQSMAVNKNFKMMSIDELLCTDLNLFQKYNIDYTPNESGAPTMAKFIEKLMFLLNERVVLDKYFVPPGYKIENIRLVQFKQLIKFLRNDLPSNDDFTDIRGELPSIADFVLNLFVCNAAEFTPFYNQKVKAAESILRTTLYGYVPNGDLEFLIECGNRLKYTCYSGKTQMKFPTVLSGALSVIVIFCHHIKFVQGTDPKFVKKGAFQDLLTEFSLKETLITKNYFNY